MPYNSATENGFVDHRLFTLHGNKMFLMLHFHLSSGQVTLLKDRVLIYDVLNHRNYPPLLPEQHLLLLPFQFINVTRKFLGNKARRKPGYISPGTITDNTLPELLSFYIACVVPSHQDLISGTKTCLAIIRYQLSTSRSSLVYYHEPNSEIRMPLRYHTLP